MGREIRMVPADWVHPQDEKGDDVPLFTNGGNFEDEDRRWMDNWCKWQKGFCESYEIGKDWEPIEDRYKHTRFSDYDGRRPSPDDYMPNWEKSQRTHLMMYETTTEGTPISPAFKTPEELARWLTDNEASAFGSMTATYEQWLGTCKSGWAMSAVITNGELKSGVAASR